MDNGSSLSASDVALLDGNGIGGNNSFFWIFGLLILMGMFNGGFNNNGYAQQAATQQDVQYTSQFGQLLDGNRDISSQVSNMGAQTVAAVNQSRYDQINVAKDIQSQLQMQLAGIASTQAQAIAHQNQCCANTRLEIANQSAAINHNHPSKGWFALGL